MRQTQAITDICTLLKVSIAVFLVWKSLETRISKVWSKKKKHVPISYYKEELKNIYPQY